MPEIFQASFKESLRIKLLIGFVTIVLIVLMFPKAESLEFEVVEGTVWIHEDLIAPMSFPILKAPDVYRTEIQNAQRSVYPVFSKDNFKFNSVNDSLWAYYDYLTELFDRPLSNPSAGLVNPTFLTDNSYNALFNVYKLSLNDRSYKSLNLEHLFKRVSEALNNIYKTGIISSLPNDNLRDSIAVRTGNVDIIEPIKKYFDTAKAKEAAAAFLQRLNYSHTIKKALIDLSNHFIFPNISYSAENTEKEILQAKNEVSRYLGIINENERIIAKHERVTKESKLKIDSYRAAKGEEYQDKGISTQLFGKFLHIASLITLLTIYFYNFRKRIFFNNVKLLVFSLMFVFVSFITYLINQITVPVPLHFLIFVPAASMILTIIFDSRVGFYSTVIVSLITGALRGNDYSFALMNLFAGALAVYTVRDIKNRSQIFRSFFFILVGYSVAVIAFGLERFASFSTIGLELAFAASNAVISPVLTYGLLIFFERLFNITTDLTLLELSNFDRPLLRDLARIAPGTFNHSMTMGTIAEAAAEKIGANTLLARVGAYYHDIGKITFPENFVENQIGEANIHEEVPPEESVDIIKKHVEEGIKLGQKYNLPNEVIDFIPMHHGTMVIKYFYEKAKERYDDSVDVDEYKYNGPIPNSKETAIVMLADGCESAVRSINDPDQEKIENIIDNIFEERIDAGQLNNSPLTLSDINKVREAFKNILVGQHHKRIRYPNQDEIEQGTDEEIEE
ncbi:MAG: HDIG domain-containing protein [Ignavibacteriaceae bacterium]|nr:HDIG domain-containing protein [Ignavibacteriaceae bacterium]